MKYLVHSLIRFHRSTDNYQSLIGTTGFYVPGDDRLKPRSVRASSLSSTAFVMGSGLPGGSSIEGVKGQASGGSDLSSEIADFLSSKMGGNGARGIRTQAFQCEQWVTL